jgi:hypothetical protein
LSVTSPHIRSFSRNGSSEEKVHLCVPKYKGGAGTVKARVETEKPCRFSDCEHDDTSISSAPMRGNVHVVVPVSFPLVDIPYTRRTFRAFVVNNYFAVELLSRKLSPTFSYR